MFCYLVFSWCLCFLTVTYHCTNTPCAFITHSPPSPTPYSLSLYISLLFSPIYLSFYLSASLCNFYNPHPTQSHAHISFFLYPHIFSSLNLALLYFSLISQSLLSIKKFLRPLSLSLTRTRALYHVLFASIFHLYPFSTDTVVIFFSFHFFPFELFSYISLFLSISLNPFLVILLNFTFCNYFCFVSFLNLLTISLSFTHIYSLCLPYSIFLNNLGSHSRIQSFIHSLILSLSLTSSL